MTLAGAVGNHLAALLRERRLLYFLLGLSLLFSLGWGVLDAEGGEVRGAPWEYAGFLHYATPLLLSFLVILLSGDEISRERQDRTLHLLFTAPHTKPRLAAAILATHVAAFGAFLLVLLAYAAAMGAIGGFQSVSYVLLYGGLAFLPLFLAMDLAVLAVTMHFTNGRASLVAAAFLVLAVWGTSQVGPFGWALASAGSWEPVSAWHPYDLASRLTHGIQEVGVIPWGSFGKLLLEGAGAALAFGFGLRRLEVGV